MENFYAEIVMPKLKVHGKPTWPSYLYVEGKRQTQQFHIFRQSFLAKNHCLYSLIPGDLMTRPQNANVDQPG